ncbi:unnamed protein product [Arctogadus glacialis]
MDCYEGIRKAREECNNADIHSSKSKDEDEDEASGVEHSNEDVKDGNEQICEGPSGKKRGKRSVIASRLTKEMAVMVSGIEESGDWEWRLYGTVLQSESEDESGE